MHCVVYLTIKHFGHLMAAKQPVNMMLYHAHEVANMSAEQDNPTDTDHLDQLG